MSHQQSPDLGHATLEPKTPVPAASYGTWTITFTVGKYGIDSGGQLKIARRLVSDWAEPQFDDPTGESYTTVRTNGAAKLRVSWSKRAYIRPFSPAIVIDVYDGSLSPNDTITIVMGDKSKGSKGMRAQTYVESAFEFLLLVDPTNSTDPRPTADVLTLPVVAAELHNLACILPSQAEIGQPVNVFIKGEDSWRNPLPAPKDCVPEWLGDPVVKLEKGQLTAHAEGQGYVRVSWGSLSCMSNPICFYEALPKHNRYWGDLHAQTGATVGVGSEDEYFSFGRDWAKLDFMSHQGNDFQITSQYWQHLNETSQSFNQEGQFIIFPGYEWSGSSPTGGDHNVFYRSEGKPILRSSHWLVPNEAQTELSPAHPADVFYEKLKQAVDPKDVIVCQHVGGRFANLRKYFDEELISLVEIVSVWGVFEWMLFDAIDKGYRVGVMANSDGHHGRPGAEGAGMTEFGIKNGLTCVMTESLTRNTIFDALQQRQCYATTGPRILFDFTVNNCTMGAYLLDQKKLSISSVAIGTSALESLQLFEGRNLIAEVRPNEFEDLSGSNHIRISWQGSRERGRQRRVTWDGTVSVEGCKILSAEPFSFDVIADRITEISDKHIHFLSKTTGDRDGLDLLLDDASKGTLSFDSKAGSTSIDLSNLTDKTPRLSFDYGGVDMQLIIEKYPTHIDTLKLELDHVVESLCSDRTAYFVKLTQVDGNMAWASPVWHDCT